MALVQAAGIGRQRQPDIGGRIRLETGRKNANHRVRFSAQHDGAAHQVRIRGKPALPETVADHGGARPSRAVLLRAEGSPHRGPHAEEREVVRRDANCFDLLGFPIVAKAHARAYEIVRGDV